MYFLSLSLVYLIIRESMCKEASGINAFSFDGGCIMSFCFSNIVLKKENSILYWRCVKSSEGPK